MTTCSDRLLLHRDHVVWSDVVDGARRLFLFEQLAAGGVFRNDAEHDFAEMRAVPPAVIAVEFLENRLIFEIVLQ